MKTFKYLLLSIALLGGLFSSCDFLEKEPTQLTPEKYFNTPEEASSFLMGVYATLAHSSFYGGNYIWLAGGDDLSHYGGAGRNPMTSVICNQVTTSDTQITGLWLNLYSGINRANMFLEHIDQVPNMNQTLKQQYVAEARFLRAYYYFILVQNWGDVPFHATSTQTVVGLDIPQTDRQELYDFIASEMDFAAENGLKSAAELNYLPGRISQSTAWGILARVYLFRAGEHYREKRVATEVETTTFFAEANKYAQKVMTKGGHDLVDLYGDFFIDLCSDQYNTKKKESIWEIEFAGNNTSDIKSGGPIGNLIGLGAPDLSNESYTGKEDPGFCYEYIFATPKLYDYYANNNDKERFLWNIKSFSYQRVDNNHGITGREFFNGRMSDYMAIYGDRGFSYGNSTQKKEGDYEYVKYTTNSPYPDPEKAKGCAKWRREFEADKKSKGTTSINFPALRYSDVLLMISEAENEINEMPTTLAYDCLNRVRRRAGIVEVGNLSKDEFREKVKQERAMELCFEMTRRGDLIRWGEYVKNMNELVSRAQQGGDEGKEWPQGITNVFTYFLIPNALNYFPIPEIERSVNKKIIQNPEW